MSILRACADWRVVAILVAGGAGVAVFAPNLIAAAIPLLLVAACPISMLVMMRTMGGQQSNASPMLDPGAVDRTAQLRRQLAATRLEQHQLERELARIESADRVPFAEARANVTVPEVRARPR
jgi:hypothetical protein